MLPDQGRHCRWAEHPETKADTEQVGSGQLGESLPGFFTHSYFFQAFLRLARAGNVPHFSCKADLGATAKGWESLA